MTQKFVGTLSTTYRRELGGLNVALNTTATYNGGYNLDVDFAHQDSYVMLNGSVILSDPSDKLSLRLTVANALNKARSEEHTSELQSLMRISYAVFCLKKKKKKTKLHTNRYTHCK